MAKVSFTKLNKIKSIPPIVKTFGEQEIEIAQYVPLVDKVDLMSSVIAQAGNGEEGFFNIVKLEAYYRIEMIQAYTNISFTEKQLEDTTKLYDAIQLNGLWAFVEDNIPEVEKNYIWDNLLNLAREITEYNHSALGILKILTAEKENLEFDIDKILGSLNNAESLATLKSIIEQAGLNN